MYAVCAVVSGGRTNTATRRALEAGAQLGQRWRAEGATTSRRHCTSAAAAPLRSSRAHAQSPIDYEMDRISEASDEELGSFKARVNPLNA